MDWTFVIFWLIGMLIGFAIARWQRQQRRLREQARSKLLRATVGPGKEIESLILDRYSSQLAIPRTPTIAAGSAIHGRIHPHSDGRPLFAPPLTEAERTQLAMEIRKTFEGPAELVEILPIPPEETKTTESTAGGQDIPASAGDGRSLRPPLDQS